MSNKYYRVKKDTFLWKEGAILKDDAEGSTGKGYRAIEDIWDRVRVGGEYISSHIIENPINADFFERVYPDNLKGNVYRTADKLREVYKKSFN